MNKGFYSLTVSRLHQYIHHTLSSVCIYSSLFTVYPSISTAIHLSSCRFQ